MGSAAQSSAHPTLYFFEDLQPGHKATYTHTVTEADIVKYAEVTGDTNPLHLNEAYAAGTMFKGRIAHGMLSAGFISTVFGTIMPGPGGVYVSQNLKFKAPVRIGDEVTAQVEVLSTTPEKKFVTFKTQCLVKGKAVIDGDATIMVPSKA